MGTSTHEVLLDSGSSISSISTRLVRTLGLQEFPAPPIHILFGDSKQIYHSRSHVHCTFSLAQQSFTHSFYVLSHQLFPITLGCDWFIHTRARLHFDESTLVIPNSLPIPIFHTRPPVVALVHSQTLFPSPALVHTPTQCLQEVTLLLSQFPSIFKPHPQTALVKFPTGHVINTGDAPPIRMASQ